MRLYEPLINHCKYYMKAYLALFLLSLAVAQNVGTQKAEYHLPYPWSKCDQSGCQTVRGSVTLDTNWRWVHVTSNYTNCFSGVDWDRQYCPDPQTCTRNCAVDGVPVQDWSNPYGTK